MTIDRQQTIRDLSGIYRNITDPEQRSTIDNAIDLIAELGAIYAETDNGQVLDAQVAPWSTPRSEALQHVVTLAAASAEGASLMHPDMQMTLAERYRVFLEGGDDQPIVSVGGIEMTVEQYAAAAEDYATRSREQADQQADEKPTAEEAAFTAFQQSQDGEGA
jgi:hypothetical protein